MENKKSCFLCDSKENTTIHKGVRDNLNIDVLKCIDCGLIYLSSFDQIDNKNYKDSDMNEGEQNIEKWMLETEHDDQRRFDFLASDIKEKSLLDFGCGTGSFLFKARTICSYVAGVEIEEYTRKYIVNNGICVEEDLSFF